MCRWMAWLGQPVLIDELLFKSQHGIVDQSLHARMGAEPTNGDGFGLGWYGGGAGPAVYRSVAPAWADPNLRELAAHVESPLFMAHVRAAIGSPVQETNCHPFRRGEWLFVHNGYLADFHLLRRDLMLAIDPELFAEVQGSTDTEVVFHLALTLGLEEDPIGALEATVGLIEDTARGRGIAGAVQATFGVSDGTTSLGGALRDRRRRPLAVHLDRRGNGAAPVSRQPALPAPPGRGPPHRLRTVLRSSRRLAGGPGGDGGDGAPRRRTRGATVQSTTGRLFP